MTLILFLYIFFSPLLNKCCQKFRIFGEPINIRIRIFESVICGRPYNIRFHILSHLRKPNNIYIRIRSFLRNPMILLFVIGHQNTFRTPLSVPLPCGYHTANFQILPYLFAFLRTTYGPLEMKKNRTKIQQMLSANCNSEKTNNLCM